MLNFKNLILFSVAAIGVFALIGAEIDVKYPYVKYIAILVVGVVVLSIVGYRRLGSSIAVPSILFSLASMVWLFFSGSLAHLVRGDATDNAYHERYCRGMMHSGEDAINAGLLDLPPGTFSAVVDIANENFSSYAFRADRFREAQSRAQNNAYNDGRVIRYGPYSPEVGARLHSCVEWGNGVERRDRIRSALKPLDG